MANLDLLLSPEHLWTAGELFADPQLPPPSAGVYAWYFDRAPAKTVPIENCHRVGRRRLLYVGISPSSANSKSQLRKRLRQHFRGNAGGSTLRKTLGCLLQEELALDFQRITPKSARFTDESEARLSEWMARHARVTWMTTPEPWIAEERMIQGHSLPLNLKGNDHHPFHTVLTAARKAMMKNASP